MKALVTGGAGFIGAHLVADLVARGDEVTVLDNLSRGSRPTHVHGERLRFLEADLRDRDSVTAAARGMDVIFHLGAQSSVMGAVFDIDYSFTSNVVGTYNVLCAARDQEVRRVVFSSSREVYGEVDELPVSEDAPLNPKNPYGASKVACEMYCRVFERTFGLDVSVLRLANVYGPGDHDRVIPIWLDQAQSGEDLVLYGGEQILDLVPVDVVVAALCRAASRSLSGQPVNVGSGTGVPLRELARTICLLPGARCGLQVVPARDGEVTRYVADTGRMSRILGIEPPSDLVGDLHTMWTSERTGAA